MEAPRDISALNLQWERQLLGRKLVEHEDEGFEALKVYSQSFLSVTLQIPSNQIKGQ